MRSSHEEYKQFRQEVYFLAYERFLAVLRKIDFYRNTNIPLDPEIAYFANDIYSYKFKPDRASWFNYLRQAVPDFYKFLTINIPLLIPDPETQQHTYVVAGSGAGKSTLLKQLIWSYLTHIDCSVVIIEPTNDFSREVAEFREFVGSDRLIYLSGDLQPGQTFTINPFEIPGIDATDVSDKAIQAKRMMADEIFEALTEIIGAGQGAGFSLPMQAVLKPCIIALLDKPHATLRDLKRFMDKNPTDLLDLGRNLHHSPDIQEFFQTRFMGDNFNVTKTAIANKIQTIFDGTLVAMTCSKSTVDLEWAVENKKVVIFNLAEAVVGASGPPFGRLVVSLLKGIAKRRALVETAKRTPIHCIIDECSDYICPSIKTVIQKQRKYALMMTLCQTEIGSGMSNDIKAAVTGSTNLKIMGAIGTDHWNALAGLVNLKRENFEPLKTGEFYVRFGRGNPTVKFKVADEFVGNNHSMTPAEWEEVRQYQLDRYYRPIDRGRELVEIIPPERPRSPFDPAPVRGRPVRVTKERVQERVEERVTVEAVMKDDDMRPAPWKKM